MENCDAESFDRKFVEVNMRKGDMQFLDSRFWRSEDLQGWSFTDDEKGVLAANEFLGESLINNPLGVWYFISHAGKVITVTPGDYLMKLCGRITYVATAKEFFLDCEAWLEMNRQTLFSTWWKNSLPGEIKIHVP